LSKLLVSEGDQVNQGELLATLEKDRAQAGYYEIRSQVAYLKSAFLLTTINRSINSNISILCVTNTKVSSGVSICLNKLINNLSKFLSTWKFF
jgi:murein DD-endopeptidase MepM/ murein hydrolase activator NlpD